MKQRLITNTYFLVFLMMILLTTTTVVLAAPVDLEDYTEITVAEGDTLWGLSKEYESYHSYSAEEFINWIYTHNKVTSSSIFPGDTLFIPVEKATLID